MEEDTEEEKEGGGEVFTMRDGVVFMSVIVRVPKHMDNTPLTTHRVRRVPPFSPFPSLPLLTWYCGMLSFPVMRSRLMLSCFIIGALPCPSGHRPAPYPVSSRSLATSPTHLSPSCPRIRSKVVKRWWYLKRGERSVSEECVCVYAGVLLAYSMCSIVDASTASCTVQLDATRHTTTHGSPSFASFLSPLLFRLPSLVDVRRPAVLPVVMMVRRLVRVHTGLVQKLERRVVERLQGPPRAVQEVVPPRVQLAARRHARHGADVELVELAGAFGEAHEVRRLHPLVAVRGEEVAA